MISKEILERALDMIPIASTDMTRFSINGVLIKGKKNKVTLVATNGHMLVERELEGSMPDGEYMLRLENVPALKLVLKEHKHQTEIDCAIDLNKGLFIGSEVGTKARIEKMTCDYPDYKNIIPKHFTECSISFNAEYLYDIAMVFKNGERRGQPHVRIVFDPTQPLTAILVHGPENSIGVIMPIRDSSSKEIASNLAERLTAAEAVS